MNLSLHASVLPQLPLDTCHISSAQICALEAAPWSHHHHLFFRAPLGYPFPSPASNSILTAAGSRKQVWTQDVNGPVDTQMYHKATQEYISKLFSTYVSFAKLIVPVWVPVNEKMKG